MGERLLIWEDVGVSVWKLFALKQINLFTYQSQLNIVCVNVGSTNNNSINFLFENPYLYCLFFFVTSLIDDTKHWLTAHHLY